MSAKVDINDLEKILANLKKKYLLFFHKVLRSTILLSRRPLQTSDD